MNASWIRIGLSQALRSASARHHITLRHQFKPSVYHSLLLFSFPSVQPAQGVSHTISSHFYCMEAQCPHLGAPLENASIYDVEEDQDDIEDAVIVCPWHEYDFSLRTGESSTGLKACVYGVEEQEGYVWIEPPVCDEVDQHQQRWEVVEVRPVSESARTGREAAAQTLHAQSTRNGAASMQVTEHEHIPELDPLPRTLTEWAVVVLNTADPKWKVEYTRRAAHAFRSGQCRQIGGGRMVAQDDHVGKQWIVKAAETPPQVPPRLADAQVVQPGREGRRGKGGSEKSRIAMLHSLANIEQWAIDLAWDIIARAPGLYSQMTEGASLPVQFFSDFVKVAEDEAKHFSLLQGRLHDMGAAFGDLPVHHGLWDSAQETMHSLQARLCIIHLVHEARGLDANPLTIKKFDNAGDKASVDVSCVQG